MPAPSPSDPAKRGGRPGDRSRRPAPGARKGAARARGKGQAAPEPGGKGRRRGAGSSGEGSAGRTRQGPRSGTSRASRDRAGEGRGPEARGRSGGRDDGKGPRRRAGGGPARRAGAGDSPEHETPWARRAKARSEDDRKAQRAGWGGVARRGAGRLRDEGPGGASQAFREAAGPEAWEPEVWIDEGAVRGEAAGAVGRGRRSPSPSRRAPRPVDEGALEPDPTLRRAVAPNRVERLEARLRDASRAFRRERFDEARRILRPLAEAAPTAESVRELLGLTYYRLGRWKQAAGELEAFRDLSGSTEQHPVLADCYRALGRHAKVAELWEELKRASPGASLVAEGRIVRAGSLADQGDLAGAIAVLEAAKPPGRRAQEHHLRVTYALADLYERAGDVPRARQLFEVVAAADPDLGDVAARLRSLR